MVMSDVSQATRNGPILERAIRILDCFDHRHPTLTVAQISELSGIPRTTTYRIVNQLEELGLLLRDEHGEYLPGLRLWEIGNRGSCIKTVAQVAHLHMLHVHSIVRTGVHFSILEDNEMLVVEYVCEHEGADCIGVHRGMRLPVHDTATGMATLAYSSMSVVSEYMEEHGEAMTTAHPRLRHEVETIRSQGYARYPGFVHENTEVLAVPVIGPHGHAIGAVAVILTDPAEEPASLIESLQKASSSITQEMLERVGTFLPPKAPKLPGR